MSDAKKLDQNSSAPVLDDMQLLEAHAVSSNEPIVGIKTDEPTRLELRPPNLRSRNTFLHRLSVHLLVFFLLGVIMFLVGAGLSYALFTGALDAHTGQLKELVHHLKDILHRFGNH